MQMKILTASVQLFNKTQYREGHNVGYVFIQLPFPMLEQVVHQFPVERN